MTKPYYSDGANNGAYNVKMNPDLRNAEIIRYWNFYLRDESVKTTR